MKFFNTILLLFYLESIDLSNQGSEYTFVTHHECVMISCEGENWEEMIRITCDAFYFFRSLFVGNASSSLSNSKKGTTKNTNVWCVRRRSMNTPKSRFTDVILSDVLPRYSEIVSTWSFPYSSLIIVYRRSHSKHFIVLLHHLSHCWSLLYDVD